MDHANNRADISSLLIARVKEATIRQSIDLFSLRLLCATVTESLQERMPWLPLRRRESTTSNRTAAEVSRPCS